MRARKVLSSRERLAALEKKIIGDTTNEPAPGTPASEQWKSRLYTYGSAAKGQTGTRSAVRLPSSVIPKPSFVALSQIVRDLKGQHDPYFIGCGGYLSMVVVDGHVFSFGAGSLGHEKTPPPVVRIPTQVALLSRVTSVSVGYQNHCAAVTANGDLYTWGIGVHGRLGHGNSGNVAHPKHVVSLQHELCVTVSCGEAHTAVVTRFGGLYTMGSGMAGQLGLGDTTDSSLPRKVSLRYETKNGSTRGAMAARVSCGINHTVVVTRCGQLLTFGWAEHGRLGINLKKDGILSSPHLVQSPFQPDPPGSEGATATVAAQRLRNYSNKKGNKTNPKRNGMAEVRGRGAHRIDEEFYPSHQSQGKEREERVLFKQAEAGGSHTLALTTCGHVYAFGSNEWGQLGHAQPWIKSEAKPQLLDIPYVTVQIAAGFGHSGAIDSNHRVWMWGWNSEGQLGLGDETDRSSPTLVSALKSHSVLRISLGRLHSAVLTGRRLKNSESGNRSLQPCKGSNDRVRDQLYMRASGEWASENGAGDEILEELCAAMMRRPPSPPPCLPPELEPPAAALPLTEAEIKKTALIDAEEDRNDRAVAKDALRAAAAAEAEGKKLSPKSQRHAKWQRDADERVARLAKLAKEKKALKAKRELEAKRKEKEEALLRQESAAKIITRCVSVAGGRVILKKLKEEQTSRTKNAILLAANASAQAAAVATLAMERCQIAVNDIITKANVKIELKSTKSNFKPTKAVGKDWLWTGDETRWKLKEG